MGETLPERIVLIGFRGAGKTSVGREIAHHLSWRFIDTDAEIENSQAMNIKDIISIAGWNGFRSIEREVIKMVCRERNCVIATGGGAVIHLENREDLRRRGFVIWLKAESSVLYKRIMMDPSSRQRRPPLTGLDPEEEINSLLREREPYYLETAHLIIDTGEKSVDEVVEEIISHLLRSYSLSI
jgi:shikimate kinase